MNQALIEQLKGTEEPPRPPTKTGVSAYLTDRQRERLEALSAQTSLSHSKVIGRLIDLAFENTANQKAP